MSDTRRMLTRSAIVFAAWTASGLLTATETQLQLSARGQTQAAWSIFAPSMVGMWLWALYTPLVVRIARRIRRLRETRRAAWIAWTTFFAAHVLVAAVVVVADTVVWTYLRPFIDGAAPPLSRVFAATLSFNVTAYLAVVTVAEAGDYAARWRERDRAAAALAHTAHTLQERLDEARLRTLEGQLQPHFLYNTLNMVAELVHDEPDVADAMLTNLGALLRRSCRESAHVIPLKDEISFVRAYAEILERRYRDRVTLTIDVPSTLEQHAVPAFMLQPLVENAFRHGVEKRESASIVGVSVIARDDMLVVRVRDRSASGRERVDTRSLAELPFDASGSGVSESVSDGIGLRNIRERLEVLFGSAAGVTLVRARGETVAAVWLPLRTATQANHARPSDLDLLLTPMSNAAGA
jgi:two-component system, LytTR family, sensor kinase